MFARQIVIDMKRLLILAGLMMACTFSGFSQEDKKPFIQYHAMSAFGVGYSYIYSPFETTYFGNLPSVGMLYCESNLLGVYLGIGGSSKKTGYNVLGFDEYMKTMALKFGANLKLGLNTHNEFIVTPYIGYVRYSVYDTSQNSIGARDEYGEKERRGLIGAAFKIKAKEFFISIHCSTVDFGMTVGMDFSDVMSMTIKKFSTIGKEPEFSVRRSRR